MGLLGMIAPVAGAALGMLTQGAQDKRQIEQQRKLQEQQIRGAKEMADYNKETSMDIWNRTNYEAQKGHMKAAGLNPALMYGQGGGGGATTSGGGAAMPSGGNAGDPNSGTQNIMGMAMMAAQLRNIEAQTEKTKVETVKEAGVDTDLAAENVRNQKFQNDLNNMIGIKDMMDRYTYVNRKLEVSQEKEMAEWEAWKAASFKGKASDDPSSPIAKAIRAGYQQTMVELETAKAEGNIKRAEAEIKEFEAGLAQEGIPPNSPWGVKIIADLLKNIGIGIPGTVDKAVKTVKAITQ